MRHEEVARDLLTPLWRGISADYKGKYARNIWEQFENAVKSAAYTARAAEFLSRITARLGIKIQTEHVEQVRGVVSSGQDRALLKMLRDDTTLLVLLVRADNEERKAEWQKKKEAK
jgi:hypothetical protein